MPEQCIVFELLLDCLKKMLVVLGYSKMHEVYNFFKCIIELSSENESWRMWLNKLCCGKYLFDFWHIQALPFSEVPYQNPHDGDEYVFETT